MSNAERTEQIISIREFRNLSGDFDSKDSIISERIRFLEAYARNVIRDELKKYEA